MLDIDDANAPPPTPDSAANTRNVLKDVCGSCNAMPIPSAGRISSSVVSVLTFRPPEIATMNELGIRNVAPASPATAGNRYKSAR